MYLLQISIFYKGFWLHQEFSTKLKKDFDKLKNKYIKIKKKDKKLTETINL